MTTPGGPKVCAWAPERLTELGLSFTAARVLAAGVQLGVFAQIASGRRSAAEVASATAASERGMTMLLDGLVALELLLKTADGYLLPPGAERYLLPDSPDFACARLTDDALWDAWGSLVECVRTGRPARSVVRQAEAERYFPPLVRQLNQSHRASARRAAACLRGRLERRTVHVLDVACGSAVWGSAIAEADPGARLTLQDFPGVLAQTRVFLTHAGILERCDFLPGDLGEVEFGKDRFDLALLGHILHWQGEPRARDLLCRLCRALRPGGKLAIVEIIPDEGRTGPPYPLLFALNMLVHSTEGGTYTLAEYRDWLTEAGFTRIETADIGDDSPLVIGIKEGVDGSLV